MPIERIASQMKKAIQLTRLFMPNATDSVVRGASVNFLFQLASILILLLLAGSTSRAQTGVSLNGTQIIGPTGIPLANVPVYVCPYNANGTPCYPQSSLYSNPNLTGLPLPQPTSTNQYGFVAQNVWVGAGSYQIQVQYNATTWYTYFVTTGGGVTSSTALVFGTTNIPLSSTPPSTGECLYNNGTNIAGVACGGSTTNALTAAVTGGAAPGSTFNGSTAVTFDYHSFGAAGINAANTYGAYLQDFSGATVKLPTTAGTCTNGLALNSSGDVVTTSCSSSGTTVNVNSAPVSNPNFNASTPAAPTGYQNAAFQVSGSNVSVNVPLVGIASNTTLAFTGTSINDDDAGVIAAHITVTGWACAAGVCTITNSGTNGLSAGDWVNVRFLTGWFTPPAPFILGTGYTLFQVLSTGLSSTQFEFSYSLNTGSCSSSCGYAESAMWDLPYATAKAINPTAPANTVFLLPTTVTIPGAATNYSALFHSISPAVTGKPGYLVLNNFNNDVGLCTPSATTEAGYQSFFSQAHTDGWWVVVGTGTAASYNSNAGGCATWGLLWTTDEQWLIAQGPTQQNIAAGNQYWDFIVDLHTDFPNAADANLLNQSNYAFNPAGAALAASAISRVINSHTSDVVNTRADYYAQQPGAATYSGNAGYMYRAPNDSPYSWCWLNAAGTSAIECMNGGSINTGAYFYDGVTAFGSGNSGGFVAQTSNTTSPAPAGYFFAPNLSTGQFTSIFVGVADPFALYNNTLLGFSYAGASSSSNKALLGLAEGNYMTIDGLGNVVLPANLSVGSLGQFSVNGLTGHPTVAGCQIGTVINADGTGCSPIPTASYGTGAPTLNTPAVVQATGGASSSLGTVSATFGTNVTSGHVITVEVNYFSGSTPALSDTLGTVFTAYANGAQIVYVGAATSTGADTLTFSGVNYYPVMNAQEWSGTSTTIDNAPTPAAASTTPSISETTHYYGDAEVSFVANGSCTTSSGITVTSGWTLGTLEATTGSGCTQIDSATHTSTTVGVKTVAWTINQSSNPWIFSLIQSGTPAFEGALYFDTSTSPYTQYAFHSGAWHQTGASGYVNPMTTLGDTVYGGAGGAATRLAGNTSASTECLTQTGTGSASAAPVWGACSGSAGAAFSAITGSTNTSAAMVVGSGASMSTSGTGTIAATSTQIIIANASSTGTTLNALAKLTGAPSTAVGTATSDTGGIVGIVTAGAGTTGSATIQTSGQASCVFSGATTAGDYVQNSTATAADCMDAGATYPTSGQVIGRVLSTNASAGTYQINLFPAEIKATSGSGSYPTPVTVSGTGVTELDLTGCITSSYRDYDIRFSHIAITAGSGASLYIQFSANNGSTWDTASNYYYGRYYAQIDSGSNASYNTSQNSGGIPPTGSASDTYSSGYIFEFRMRFNNPMGTDAVKMGSIEDETYQISASNVYRDNSGFYYNQSSSVNAIRLVLSGGSGSPVFTGTATCQPLPQ